MTDEPLRDEPMYDDWIASRQAVEPSREFADQLMACLLYTSPSPRDLSTSRMPSSA